MTKNLNIYYMFQKIIIYFKIHQLLKDNKYF